jgi:ATP-binding protein involved in chromosome partitioning
MLVPPMQITHEQVVYALSQVEEPDLKKDLVTLGMIRDVAIDGLKVSFTVVLTTPACPLKDLIRNACITAIKTLVNKEAQVDVLMTANVTTRSTSGLQGVKNLIAVGSGKGGVGKSTVAANLAIALAKAGSRVGLLDADIYGPSIPLMFGLEGEKPYLQNVDGHQKMLPIEKHGIHLMSIGFLIETGQAVVMRGPMVSKTFSQLVHDTHWVDIDYLIVDLPPGTGDIHITIAQQFPLIGAVIVTTPQEVALADARKAAKMFRSLPEPVALLGVVENMSWFSPEDNPTRKYYLFGEGGGARLAEEFNVPLLGQLPLVESIRSRGDDGLPAALDETSAQRQAFAALAQNVAQQVSIQNAQSFVTSNHSG